MRKTGNNDVIDPKCRVWPENWAGMLPGQSHLISRCITVIVQSVGTVELRKVHLYSRAARRLQRAGAGAGPRLARAHISGRRWRLHPKTGRARAGPRGADQPAQTAGARCWHRPCPRPHTLALLISNKGRYSA